MPVRCESSATSSQSSLDGLATIATDSRQIVSILNQAATALARSNGFSPQSASPVAASAALDLHGNADRMALRHDDESSLVNRLTLSVFMISVIGRRLPDFPGVFTHLSIGS